MISQEQTRNGIYAWINTEQDSYKLFSLRKK